jgi:lipopolysaccharide cholinephosphotransferase
MSTRHENEVRVAHRILLDLLVEFNDFCVKNNLKYYIIGGTLLGAVRHKGFIPWDIDADVAMPRDDYEKMLQIIKDQFPKEYFIQNIETEKHFHTPKTKILVLGAKKNDPNRYVLSTETGLNLDIFPLDKAPMQDKERRNQRKKLLLFKKLLIYKIRMKINPKNIKGYLKRFLRSLVRLFLKPFREKDVVNYLTKTMIMYNNTNSDYLCSMASHYDYNKQVMEKEIYG